MAEKIDTALRNIAKYYSDKLGAHGDTSRGVDWNGPESQILRFTQLCQVCDTDKSYSINDLGCGYGALYEFLSEKNPDNSYCGYDVAEDMIVAAKARYAEAASSFFVSTEPHRIADFGVASGIFNVRLDCSDSDWIVYIERTLDTLNRTSQHGFAFNCLTSYSDVDKMKDYLYYADPCNLFDLCKKKYSKNVALLHDYGLYEFTILVRKF